MIDFDFSLNCIDAELLLASPSSLPSPQENNEHLKQTIQTFFSHKKEKEKKERRSKLYLRLI